MNEIGEHGDHGDPRGSSPTIEESVTTTGALNHGEADVVQPHAAQESATTPHAHDEETRLEASAATPTADQEVLATSLVDSNTPAGATGPAGPAGPVRRPEGGDPAGLDGPLWEPDTQTPQCPGCRAKFSFFNRRHHCRRCGRVFCGGCSANFTRYLPNTYVVFPPSEGGGFVVRGRLTHARFRTCDTCDAEMRMLREALGEASSAPSTSSQGSQRTGESPACEESLRGTKGSVPLGYDGRPASAADANECPLCGELLPPSETASAAHIEQCLHQQEFGSPPEGTRRARNRMLISHLPQDGLPLHVNEDNECVICLEEFVPGAKVARLECLCCFHYTCIKDWVAKKGFVECPIHSLAA